MEKFLAVLPCSLLFKSMPLRSLCTQCATFSMLTTWGHVISCPQEPSNLHLQVAETLPQEVLDKMHAPPKPKDIPVVNPFEMQQADGFLFGIPTWYS